MLSTVGEQELAGVTLKSVHFRESLQLDASHTRDMRRREE